MAESKLLNHKKSSQNLKKYNDKVSKKYKESESRIIYIHFYAYV